ncbi:hypothetical protein E6W39_20545 [Kitasatospora acidiphila]|uniref:Uncharacterized protein n=1 Tax=Kitasatospora acidiphila TaxID=2567942 RepID=A0A540W5A4_9ACTN|nr:hypothetical protein [Kitasatospora acidiphila]TQF04182.1 hypothetical protein E6W39_20545 [Kitasatospora acidiphila]
MKIAGHYREFWSPGGQAALGSIAEFTRRGPAGSEEELVTYLGAGHRLRSFMGVVGDVLGSDQRLLGGEDIRTDGEWVWRDDLSSYLRTYHVELPAEFVEHARSVGFTVPAVPRHRLVESADSVRALL